MTLFAMIGDDSYWEVTSMGLIVLLALYLIALFQQKCLIEPTIKQMRDLHLRRCLRVKQALQGPTGSDWNEPPPDPGFPFKHWVELSPIDGTVRVASQTFITSQAFEVVARDDSRNIPHARVVCGGRGDVLITSHGSVYRARFADNQWDVKILPPNEIGAS